ncbi:MAG: MMPL family transporter, partial [Spirochaetales bacterium]|nr:MMPL family transporter [Spirochaetales bacterium]
VIVLVLSTSYGVHLYRYHATHGGDIGETLKSVSGVVIAAGFTTMVGFLSLVVTPSVLLRQLGLLIIAGISAGLISSLVLFPPILARLPARPGWRRRRREEPDNGGKLLSMASQEPRRPGVRILLAVAVLVPFLVAIPALRPGFSSRDTFRAGSLVADTMEYFVERAQSNQQVQIVVDTGVEYGLVDMDTYQDLRRFESLLDDDPAVLQTISFVDFVDWMNGRLTGSIDPVPPVNQAELGEVMELLSGEGIDQLFETLVDVEWRRARILVQASLPSLGHKDGSLAIDEFRSRIETYSDTVSSGKITLLGEVISNLLYTKYLARSQYISVLVFLPVILLFLLFLFRSFGWAAITLIPTVIGIAVYFGTVSMLGYLHDPIHVFMVAALMGVSNDDVLYFVIVLKDKITRRNFAEALSETIHRTGVAILQTTVVITAGIAVFLASDFILLRRGGLVAIVALWASSLTTLLVLPGIVKLLPLSRNRDARPAGGLSRQEVD